MSKDVAIVVCWQAGTEDILRIWLDSFARHTDVLRCNVKLVVVAEKGTYGAYWEDSYHKSMGWIHHLPPPAAGTLESSKLHGWMLDQIIPAAIENEYVLTMDSDCFPISNGWLDELLAMLDDGATVAGILQPWAPPPPDLDHKKLEYRVRAQHCRETTHVACQIMRTADYRLLYDKGCRYNGGDDTGLLIPKMVKEQGGKIAGFKLTRCPRVLDGCFNAEFNRYSSLVFGDKVYHHGGFSRSRVLQDEKYFAQSFGWFEDLMLWGKGAEILLNDKFAYKYSFNQEEEVAKEKMQRLFGMRNQRMLG
jgi:hypothetical protein